MPSFTMPKPVTGFYLVDLQKHLDNLYAAAGFGFRLDARTGHHRIMMAAPTKLQSPQQTGSNVLGRRRRSDEIAEAAARGVRPQKPIVTSPTNAHRQRDFDRLCAMADAGDRAVLAAFPRRGTDTYGRKINEYRDHLIVWLDSDRRH